MEVKICAIHLLLLVALLAAPCTTVCGASMTGARAPKCDPLALRPCVPAAIYGTTPSGECCAKLRGQMPCLCR
jgi:hypothetical protein